MREAGRIEIEAQPLLLGPIYPWSKVARLQFIQIYFFFCVGIDGVQVHLVLARDERQCLLQVLAQLIRRSGTAGIAAGYGDTAAQLLVFKQKTADIVPLPAVEGNLNLCELLQHLIHVDAVCCV
ncbi:hypothetical protein D3C73_694280 [compost metagenome]